MTKLKSKKMSKSTFAVIIMAIAMVAMIAFGGTYAYFTASASTEAKSATFGKVVLTADDTLEVKKETGAVPGDKIFEGKVTFDNDSTVSTIVIANFKVVYSGLVWDADNTADESFADFVKKEGEPATAKAPVAVDSQDLTKGYFFDVVNMPITANADVLSGFAIDTGVWTPVDGKAAYVCGTSANGFEVEAGESAYLLGSESADAVVALSTNVNRHFEDGVYQGKTSGELVWEEATVTMTISFDQVQYANLLAADKYDAQGVLLTTVTETEVYNAAVAALPQE